MLGHDAAAVLRNEGAAFELLVRNEIQSVRGQQKTLLLQGKTGYATIIVLLSCICINIIAFLVFPEYPSLFIAASIYLQMFYFLTLLIPVGGGRLVFQKSRS